MDRPLDEIAKGAFDRELLEPPVKVS